MKGALNYEKRHGNDCVRALALQLSLLLVKLHPFQKASDTGRKVQERVGIIEKVMNDLSISLTFNEGMKVEGETAYCIDINTDFKNGYKTRAGDAIHTSADQISDVALSLEYVKQ